MHSVWGEENIKMVDIYELFLLYGSRLPFLCSMLSNGEGSQGHSVLLFTLSGFPWGRWGCSTDWLKLRIEVLLVFTCCYLMWWTDSLEKTLMLAKTEGRRTRRRQRMRWLDGIINSMDKSEQALGVGDGQGSLVCCSPWGHKESDTTERLNWTSVTLHISRFECVVSELSSFHLSIFYSLVNKTQS